MRPRLFFFIGLVECVLLGTFSLLCGCGKNHNEHPTVRPPVVKEDVRAHESKISLQGALQML
jgi:hypothetical protein